MIPPHKDKLETKLYIRNFLKFSNYNVNKTVTSSNYRLMELDSKFNIND